MSFNKYTIFTSIRVILIFLTLLALSYFWDKPHRLITNIFLILLVIAQVYSLIKFVNKINADFARFLIELKEKDTSGLYFPENLEKNFKNLKYSFQQISDEIKKTRIEKMEQEQYLACMIENIENGIISFDEDGKVKTINSSAKKMLQMDYLNSVWSLDKIKKGLAQKLVLARTGQSRLFRIDINHIPHDFLFRVSEIKIADKLLKVIVFQDLKRELDEKEASSWKKLIRVLTHEMMNSLTPIATLSVAVRRTLRSNDILKAFQELSNEDLLDIDKNNEAIDRRSKGLLEFIQQYRQLTRVPELQKEKTLIKEILSNIQQLFSETLKKEQINLKLEILPSDMEYLLDKKLIEQVLINLIKNSIEALENSSQKRISLKVENKNQKLIFEIKDNGAGVKSEIKDDVFVPFFTTKKQGSGIGLSLSREIIQKHGGEIYFNSTPNEGTCFYIKI